MLEKDISQYEFFQAVQLFSKSQNDGLNNLIFKAQLSTAFPTSDIISLTENTEDNTYSMLISFLSVWAPAGLLPTHYTESLLTQLHHKNFALADFVDIFHHCAVMLFYDAWKKYRIFLDENQLSVLLMRLMGFQKLSDKAWLFYAGYFSQERRTAEILSQMLTDFFSISIKILPLQEEWLELEPAQMTKLPTANNAGTFHQLGIDMAIGKRVSSCQHKFRLQVGPLTAGEFDQFLPYKNSCLTQLCEIVRAYIGVILLFDIQLVVYGNEITPWQFNSESQKFSLGWNTWLGQTGFPETVADVILQEIKS